MNCYISKDTVNWFRASIQTQGDEININYHSEEPKEIKLSKPEFNFFSTCSTISSNNETYYVSFVNPKAFKNGYTFYINKNKYEVVADEIIDYGYGYNRVVVKDIKREPYYLCTIWYFNDDIPIGEPEIDFETKVYCNALGWYKETKYGLEPLYYFDKSKNHELIG